jgi:hypothetical protein
MAQAGQVLLDEADLIVPVPSRSAVGGPGLFTVNACCWSTMS